MRVGTLVLAATLLVGLGNVPAWGQHILRPVAEVAAEGAGVSVQVNGLVVMRFRGVAGARRAHAVAERLRSLPPGVSSVELAAGERGVDLWIAGRRLVSVDADQAKANRTSPQLLAELWATRLRQALSVRRLQVATEVLVLPVGGTSRVEVHTWPPGLAQLGAYDSRVVQVRWESPRRLAIEGRAVGTARIPLRYGHSQREVLVSVRPLAGQLPHRMEVVVTGDPAPADVVREAVLRALEWRSRTAPGALLEVVPVEGVSVGKGEVWHGEVPARIRSPFALPVEGVVPVAVRNLPVELLPPSRLLLSNNPERITRDGVLFQEVVRGGESVRMLYHHSNGASRDKVVTVWLRNPHPWPARLHLQLASPKAWHDTMGVGHAAARRFLELSSRGAGYVLELPPRAEHRFTAQRTQPEQVVSGILQVQVLDGGPLEVSVSVRSVYVLDRAVRWEVWLDDKPHPRGVFGPPVLEVAARLVVGSEWQWELGRSHELRELRTGAVLEGDYGVTYRLRLQLENPTDRPAAVELVCVASSGPAYATFVVDGQLVDLKFLPAGASAPVFATTLAPREVRAVELVTMPESASWYPVRLVWRSR